MTVHQYIASTNSKIPSVNNLYRIGRNGSGGAWLYIDPDVVKFKKQLSEILYEQGIEESLESYERSKIMVEIDITFALLDNFWVRDTSNLVKIVEDVIKECAKIDDNLTTKLVVSKKINDVDLYEMMIITINVLDVDEDSLKLSALIGDQSGRTD